MKNKSRVNNLVAALKEMGIDASAESFFQKPVEAFISIVTPCSRPENLSEMSKSINIPDERYRWIVVFDAEAVPDIELPKNVIALAVKDKDGISGNPQRNYAIDFIASNPIHKDEYLLFLDDDTIMHPLFWDEVKNSSQDIVCWAQCYFDGAFRLNVGQFKLNHIDSGSFMVKRTTVGNLRWNKSRYDADGLFAEQVSKRTSNIRKIEKFLSVYNFLRKRSKDDMVAHVLGLPRVYTLEFNYLNGNNRVDGLIDMCRKYIKDTDKGVEIGCFSGVSSRAISLHCGTLDCVDPWSWVEVAVAEKMFDAMMPFYPNIRKVKMPSIDAANTYPDGSLDFVYIDADHTYQAVIDDIKAWESKVKPGGYIAGHDAHMYEVLKAVIDTLGSPIDVFSDSSWIFRKK